MTTRCETCKNAPPDGASCPTCGWIRPCVNSGQWERAYLAKGAALKVKLAMVRANADGAAYWKGAEDEMKLHFANGGCKHAIAEAAGSLELARGLLDQRAGVCRRFASWQNDDGDMGPAPRDCGRCWDCRARAFLATPIATPGTPTEEET